MVTVARLIGITVGFYLGIVAHDAAQAAMAARLGDRYPKMQGRVTLKPKPHVDPVGTLIMPGLFLFLSLIGQPFRFVFGYGKQMQFNPSALRNPKRDRILIALAGPAVNVAIVAAAGYAARVAFPVGATRMQVTVWQIFVLIMAVNAFLLVINILPIPPLDGSKMLAVFLSPATQFKMQEYGQYFLLFLVVLFIFLPGVPGAMADPICRAFSGVVCGL